MYYDRIEEAVFIKRINRFAADIDTKRGREICHVKNTGRCEELFIPGRKIYVQRSDNPVRKTACDLIAVESKKGLVNVDSQIPNKVAIEWLEMGNYVPKGSLIYTERKFGNSRLDLYLEEGSRKIYMEVKGVTLEREGTAYFPDAPTERGVKHLHELIYVKEKGYEAAILFVIQMAGICEMRPNDRTHPEFGKMLRGAKRCGVDVMAINCIVGKDSIFPGEDVPVQI